MGGIIRPHLGRRNHTESKRHNPQMLPKIEKAPERIHQTHGPGAEAGWHAADGIVHRRTNHLRPGHVRKGGHCRRALGFREGSDATGGMSDDEFEAALRGLLEGGSNDGGTDSEGGSDSDSDGGSPESDA